MKALIYNNLESFIADTLTCPEKYRGLSQSRHDKFWGSDTFESALPILRHGNNVEAIELSLKSHEKFTNRTTIDLVTDVAGSVVDIGAFLEGVPENMIDFPIVENNKFIDVVVSVNDLAQVNVKVFNNRATACAYLVDTLEADGYRVKLTAFSCSEVEGDTHAVAVTIKEYQEPLSVGQISGACSAVFFRRMVIMNREKYFLGVTSGVTSVFSKVKTVLSEEIFNQNYEAIYLPNIRSMESDRTLRDFDLLTVENAIQWAEHYSNNKIAF